MVVGVGVRPGDVKRLLVLEILLFTLDNMGGGDSVVDALLASLAEVTQVAESLATGVSHLPKRILD